MPRKPKGSKKNGKVREFPVVDGGKQAPTKEPVFAVDKVEVPDKLSGPVTVRSLAKGKFQKAATAFFAPHIIPSALRSLARNVEAGDARSIECAFEVYGLLQRKGATNVLVSQSNVQQTGSGNSAKAGGFASFEDVIERLEQDKQAMALRRPAVFDATPVGTAEPEE